MFDEFQINRMKTVALATSQIFADMKLLKVTLWPDLKWTEVKVFQKWY